MTVCIVRALALVLIVAAAAPASVLAATLEPSGTPMSAGGGLGEAVSIGPPALGLIGIVVIVLLGRLARRRRPQP